MFDGHYFLRDDKFAKNLVAYYGYQFFFGKKVLDLGCGYASLSGCLYKLGADVLAIDARPEHLQMVQKKFNKGIKTQQVNLDVNFPFINQKFDLILDLGLLCHLSPKTFDKHLREVCRSASNLVLELAVADSQDPNLILASQESKSNYDMSYNNLGCRPSPAAVEKILTECGMSFKRIINSKYNAGEYKYDWVGRNDSSTSFWKRGLWIAENHQSQNTNLRSSIALLSPNSQPALHITTHLPRANLPNTQIFNRLPTLSITNVKPIIVNSSDKISEIQFNSQKYSLFMPEQYAAPIFNTMGIIDPINVSAKKWIQKIAPLFPNIKITKYLSMQGFATTTDRPNVIMTDIDHLKIANRLWIDEYDSNTILTTGQLDILKRCQTIITPSLLNAAQINQYLPEAKIIRALRPWTLPNIIKRPDNYFIYLEKNPSITNQLYQAWQEKYGQLLVVGSRIRSPSHIKLIPDTLAYQQLIQLVANAKCLIDITYNTYYLSGLIKLCQAINTPVMTNNLIDTSNNINQDKTQSNLPTINNIQNSIEKFLSQNNVPNINIEQYNQEVNQYIGKLLC